jgi:hypothetical protein
MRRLAGATMLMPLLVMKRDTMLIYGVEEPDFEWMAALGWREGRVLWLGQLL